MALKDDASPELDVMVTLELPADAFCFLKNLIPPPIAIM